MWSVHFADFWKKIGFTVLSSEDQKTEVNTGWFKEQIYIQYRKGKVCCLQARTTDAQWSLGLGQTISEDKFLGIWGIFGWFISTNFGTVSPLSMFSIIQPTIFLQRTRGTSIVPLQRTKPLYPNPKHPNTYLGFEFGTQRIRNLAFVCP